MHNLAKTSKSDITSGKDFRPVFIRWSWIFYAICVMYQLVFFPDFVNLMMVLTVGIAWLIVTRVVLQASALKKFPLSTFLILGFSSTQFFLPLLFTTLEGKPLIYNLELPTEVFFHSIAALIVLILAHSFYELLSKMTYNKSFSLLGKMGFYDPPSELQIWLIGFIGMASFVYIYFAAGEREVTGPAYDKLIQGLVPFAYAPFFIPFGKLFGNRDANLKRIILLLIPYALLLFILSIGRNSRGAFMTGFVSVGFTYFLGLLIGTYKIRLLTPKNIIIAILGLWIFTGPLADLGTAMVIVRSERDEVPPIEMIDLTLEAFKDKEAIEARRLSDVTEEVQNWDERYLDNIFTARFANIKFNDVSLVNASIVRELDPAMREFSIAYIWSVFPEPILDALGIDVDKEEVRSLSLGDYLYVAAGGGGTISSFRTGHFAGTGITAFGWWYLVILGIGMVPVFFLFDKFFQKKIIQKPHHDNAAKQNMNFSFCGLLFISSIFGFLPNQSVVQIAEFLIRDWLQIVFLYFIVFHLTRMLTTLFRSKKFKQISVSSNQGL